MTKTRTGSLIISFTCGREKEKKEKEVGEKEEEQEEAKENKKMGRRN